MRLLLSPLALGLLVLALGPRPGAAPDPCDVAGTYALDRAPIVASVVASMDASLADLGPRPPSGTLAATRWTAEEDGELARAVQLHGDQSWQHVAAHMSTRRNAQEAALGAQQVRGGAGGRDDEARHEGELQHKQAVFYIQYIKN